MRCATGLYKDAMKMSHLSDVVRNHNYNIGTPYPYPLTYAWLCSDASAELHERDLEVPQHVRDDGSDQVDQIEPSTSSQAPSLQSPTPVSVSSHARSIVQYPLADSPSHRQRPIGNKAAKAGRASAFSMKNIEHEIAGALMGFRNTFKEATDLSLAELRDRAGR